jgi:thiosulfate/3-mercaptopyruvate sulfurtransferase
MRPLISADELLERASDPALRRVDVRFDLSDPEAGRRAYRAGHLPGAVYLHLDEDLSGPLRPDGIGGRHPLPDPHELARRLGRAGVGDAHEVVVYDDAGGAMAGRLWWLLHWIGRPRVRVLDGGLAAWTAAGGALSDAPASPEPARSTADPQAAMVASAEEVRDLAGRDDVFLVDARAPERYRGEAEPLDRRAGHVPGARNRPFAGNLEGGRFRAPEALRARFAPAEQARHTVVYCGSGVTAAHDALAMALAGLAMPRLYAGSWSDWSSRDGWPAATGDEEAAEPSGAQAPHAPRG